MLRYSSHRSSSWLASLLSAYYSFLASIHVHGEQELGQFMLHAFCNLATFCSSKFIKSL